MQRDANQLTTAWQGGTISANAAPLPNMTGIASLAPCLGLRSKHGMVLDGSGLDN